MKFSLRSTANSARLGLITNVSRLPDFEMETPHVFLYTKGGAVPYLSHEVLEMVTKDRLGLNIPIPSITCLQDRMKIYKKSIAEFTGMREYLTYCAFLDPGEKRIGGFHEKDNISLSTRYGREKFTAVSYMNFIENLKPDMFLLLADGDTDSKSSQKRVGKAFNNTVTLFEKCMEIFKEAPGLKTSQVIGAIEGGFDLTLRENSSKLIGESDVFGVVVDGLHDYSETVSEMSFNDVKELIKMSLKHIPDDKLRIIHGSWNPSVVLDLVKLGIDMFDTSYPTYVSEHGGALIFPNTSSLLEPNQSNGLSLKQNSIKSNGDVIQDVSKSEDKSEEPASKKVKLMKKSKFHMTLSDPIYVSDFSPILENCTCLTCKNHTRAYIHHLVTVKELLGKTLLMMHNLHHYLLFVKNIRKSLQSDKFEIFKENFECWLRDLDRPS